MKQATPMIAQYMAIKAKYPDALLFFRLGDFYEMFFEDAEIGSSELGIALTGRDAGEGRRAPMCGVPYHSVDEHIKTLISRGYKVAICEQVEDASKAKGLVKRDVVRVITPGTYWEGAEDSRSSYVAGLYVSESRTGLCAFDLSTGEVLVASFDGWDEVLDELERLRPGECVIPETLRDTSYCQALISRFKSDLFTISSVEDEKFYDQEGNGGLEATFGSEMAAKIKNRASPETFMAVKGLVNYVYSTQMNAPSHLKEPRFYKEEKVMEIDDDTRKNLELVQRIQGGTYGSLLWVLDQCRTPMGSRLLKTFVERPLCDRRGIEERLDAVEELTVNSNLRNTIRDKLKAIRDLERLITRASYKSCNARDLVFISASLELVPQIKDCLSQTSSSLLRQIQKDLDEVPEVTILVKKSIVENPPVSLTEGELIRNGYNEEIDELRRLAFGGKKWLVELENKEKARTGIKSLKVGYNRVFGYYIEVTKPNLHLVPGDYIRKQTLVSAERFITPELKEKENIILGAEEKLFREEYNLFCSIRDYVTRHTRRIQNTAAALALLDVLSTFAQIADMYGYVRPTLTTEKSFYICDGRHPVLERILPVGTFVPNDLNLTPDGRSLIITGPNMGGKSTFCRQAALIAVMAQCGSFVPAKECKLFCLDKLFARIGAYDDLIHGQSTFMVEMSQLAGILKRATSDSLVILDEIGRGTSTFDGLAVAWAVVEYLSDEKQVGAMCLVATHYRELTLLSDLKPGIVNYHVSVKKTKDDIYFLRKVKKGVAEGSYGVEVSAMAGLPEEVVARAREILLALEAEARRGSRSKTGILSQVAGRSVGFEIIPGQEALFSGVAVQHESINMEIVEEIKRWDLEYMTPIEAFTRLCKIKARLEEK